MKLEWQGNIADHPRTDDASTSEDGRMASDVVLTNPTLRFDLIDAYRHRDIARLVYERKQACYARFGAAAASVPLEDEMIAGRLHLVTATDLDSGSLVGGVGIYKRVCGAPLPMEVALHGMEALQPEIRGWHGRRVFELSGLWTEDVWRKTGLSEHLLHAAFAATHVLDAERVVAFGHHHLLSFYGTVGLLQVPGIDPFKYPNPDYVSTVIWVDPADFATVPLAKRRRVIRYADAFAESRPIFWRSFAERGAVSRPFRDTGPAMRCARLAASNP